MAHSIQLLTDALKSAREKRGLSQRAFSQEIGVPQSRISKIESGAVDLRTSNLLALSRALGLVVMLVPRQLVPARVRADAEKAFDLFIHGQYG